MPSAQKSTNERDCAKKEEETAKKSKTPRKKDEV